MMRVADDSSLMSKDARDCTTKEIFRLRAEDLSMERIQSATVPATRDRGSIVGSPAMPDPNTSPDDLDDEVHVFDNGLRVYRRHISPVQAARYVTTNLHEPVEEAWFRRLSLIGTSEFRFADVGAGIGYYSILPKLIRPSARVFSFEPLPAHARHLGANLALNGIDENTVRILDRAVCDSIGQEAFHQEDFGSRLISEPSPTSTLVETTTLEAVVEDTSGPLDLVKIDGQGDELRVIIGDGRALRRIHG